MQVLTPAYEPTLDGYKDGGKATVNRAEFEGGYSQRSRPGPNSVGRSLSLSWEVPDSEKDALFAFFEARAGAEAFLYQPPWEASQTVWTCEAWDSVPIGKRGTESFWRVTTTFRKEFDIV